MAPLYRNVMPLDKTNTSIFRKSNSGRKKAPLIVSKFKIQHIRVFSSSPLFNIIVEARHTFHRLAELGEKFDKHGAHIGLFMHHAHTLTSRV